MSRKKRNFRDKSYYHIVIRGVQKCRVFENTFDYLKFTQLLELACEKYPVEAVAFTLMPNYYHIVIRAIKAKDVSNWAKWLQGVYTQWFNNTHGRDNPLWQGRFYASEVGGGEHLAIMWKYVDENPVKARLTDRPEDWRWSSAYVRAHTIEMDHLVEPDWWWTDLRTRWWSTDLLDEETLCKHKKFTKRHLYRYVRGALGSRRRSRDVL